MTKESNELLCVISPSNKGFWVADIYFDGQSEGESPDWFCTGKIGGTKDDIITKVKESYPDAKFTDGITGICIDCGEDHFNLDSECIYCGGIIGEA